MTNNDVLRRLRYAFSLSDRSMIKLFTLAGAEFSREQISNWLKQEEQEGYKNLNDQQLALFLNGFIISKRGKKDGVLPVAEKTLNNNLILRKLKIALNLDAEKMIALIAVNQLTLSKHELSAFFRKVDHKHYRVCKDQVLRNFLQGLIDQHRPSTSEQKAPIKPLSPEAKADKKSNTSAGTVADENAWIWEKK